MKSNDNYVNSAHFSFLIVVSPEIGQGERVQRNTTITFTPESVHTYLVI